MRIHLKAWAALALIVAGLLCPAHAAQLELGLGITQATPVGNGGWYQLGLPHHLDLRSSTWSVGLVHDLAPQWRGRVQYVNLGMYRSDAMAADRDEDYSPAAHACLPGCNVARYIGNGSANGIVIAAERLFDFGAWRLGIEAGPYLYRPIWRVTVEGWKAAKDQPGQTIQHNNPEHLKIGAVVGFSVGQGAWSLSLRHYWNKCTPSTYACLWREVDTLSVLYRF